MGMSSFDDRKKTGLAMQLECTVKELANGIRVHPPLSESIVDTGREALNWAAYLPRS
jgi:hypothetical protein